MKNFLNKSFFGMKVWYFIPFWVLALLGLILGSVYDRSLSESIAKQGTPFGMIIESYGSAFIGGIGAIGVGIMSRGAVRKENKTWLIVASIIFSVVVLAAVWYFNFDDLKGSNVTAGYGYTLPTAVAAILAAAWNIGLYALGFFLCDKELPAWRLVMLGLTIVLCFGLYQGLMNLVKIIAARPRYRFLVWADNAYSIDDFRAWWQFALGHKLDNGGNSDALKSFPSGHTGGTAVFMTLPLVFAAFKGTRDKEIINICGVLGVLALTIAIAFARIINGAHFLSDVSAGTLLSTIGTFVMCIVADKVFAKHPEVDLTKKA